LTEVEQLILDFLGNEAKVSSAAQAMMASNRSILRVTGAHLAAYFGLGETMAALLKDGQDPDIKNTYGQTPLSWAARKGHKAVVELLLTKDSVDPHSKDIAGRSPLSWAAENGHEAVVNILLTKDGVHLDDKETGGRIPRWRTPRINHGEVEFQRRKEAPHRAARIEYLESLLEEDGRTKSSRRETIEEILEYESEDDGLTSERGKWNVGYPVVRYTRNPRSSVRYNPDPGYRYLVVRYNRNPGYPYWRAPDNECHHIPTVGSSSNRFRGGCDGCDENCAFLFRGSH
jgi:hypothetical protein